LTRAAATTANVLPDDANGVGPAFAGRQQLNQVWCDNGNVRVTRRLA
jgi:hypothetical protein